MAGLRRFLDGCPENPNETFRSDQRATGRETLKLTFKDEIRRSEIRKKTYVSIHEGKKMASRSPRTGKGQEADEEVYRVATKNLKEETVTGRQVVRWRSVLGRHHLEPAGVSYTEVV